MKKLYFMFTAAMLMMANVALAEKDLKLVSSESYGDAMTGGTAKSGETKYFYDNTGKIVSKLEMKGNEPFQRTEYNYDAKNHLISETEYQWGLFDDGKDGWNDGQTIEYRVDANGNRVAEIAVNVLPWGDTQVYDKYKYTYDAQGNMTSESYYFAMRGASPEKQWTANYSDFSAGKNKPAKKVMTSIYESECYTATMTYDAKGNKIEEIEEYADGTYGKKYTWEYNADGVVTLYRRQKWIDEVMDFYTEMETRYEIVNGNPNVLKHSDWSAMPYFDGDDVVETQLTMNPGSTTIDKYVDFADMAEMFAINIEGEVSNANTNTVKLTATMPEFAQLGTVRYDVYRDSQFAASYLISDLATAGNIDAEKNLVYIYDEAVKNGTHKYFIQIVKPATEEEFEEDVEWIGYNVSNVVTLDVKMQNLPVATNIRLASASIGDGTNGSAVVAYDFPSTIDPSLGFDGNYLFVKTLGTFRLEADSSTKNAGNGTLTASLIASETIDVYIKSYYKYGKTQSETVTLNMAQTTEITTVEQARQSNALFFDLSGRQVSNANLHGTYIMIAGGKATKVLVK